MTQRSKYKSYDTELIELSAKDENGFTGLPSEEQYIELKVCEGDTLQGISIRCRCPVAELKRINNLHRDNEIYARKIIKVPQRFFSLVAVHKSGNNSPNKTANKALDNSLLSEKLVQIKKEVEKEPNPSEEGSVNKIIFDTRIATEENETCSDEEVLLLPAIRDTQSVAEEFNCNGADWGISWPVLIGILFIVFLGLLVYVFYIAEHPEKFHHKS